MARKFLFICDGCDCEESNDTNTRPVAWADLSIEISGYTIAFGGVGTDKTVTTLLCGGCQHTLQAYADPESWPRPARDSRAEERV